MDIRSQVQDLVNQVLSGNALAAFDQYYADDVVMRENRSEPTVGKAANRAREIQFFDTIAEVHRVSAPKVIVDGSHAVIEWFMDITLKSGVRVQTEQLALQTWRDGKIVEERFFYDSGK